MSIVQEELLASNLFYWAEDRRVWKETTAGQGVPGEGGERV